LNWVQATSLRQRGAKLTVVLPENAVAKKRGYIDVPKTFYRQ